jgi:UPF0271 protein
MRVAPGELRATVASQCARLLVNARAVGIAIEHVKPHGALYHAANADADVARAVVEGAVEALGGGVTIIGPARGALAQAAERARVGYAREGFADRGTLPDGSLVPRGSPGALIEDPVRASEQARTLAASGTVDTICVHGDTPGALVIARAVRAALDEIVA